MVNRYRLIAESVVMSQKEINEICRRKLTPEEYAFLQTSLFTPESTSKIIDLYVKAGIVEVVK